MAIIYPGNFVERLNAYSTTAANRQGVEALPGINFFSAVGVVTIPAAGLAAATNPSDTLKILSPDMRADDKPRLDKDMIIPDGANIYRVAIRGINCSGAASGNEVEVVKAAAGTQFTLAAMRSKLTAAADKQYSVANNTAFDGLTNATCETLGADTTMYLKHAQAISVTNADDQAAVIVEVNYYMNGAAPDEDAVNLPYLTETGSS